MKDSAAGITPESCAQGRFLRRPCAPQLLRHLGRRSIGARGVGGHASLSCPASHDGRFVSFEKVCAANFRPSTIMSHGNNGSARPHAVTLARIASAADWSSSLVSGVPDRCDPATGGFGDEIDEAWHIEVRERPRHVVQGEDTSVNMTADMALRSSSAPPPVMCGPRGSPQGPNPAYWDTACGDERYTCAARGSFHHSRRRRTAAATS